MRFEKCCFVLVGATLLVLFLGYINVHPEIYRSIPDNRVHLSEPGTINWSRAEDLRDPPLILHSDGYRFSYISTEIAEINSFWNLFESPQSTVHYSWFFEVENTTDQSLSVTVHYNLVGDGGGRLSNVSSSTERIGANQTRVVRGEGDIAYGLAASVVSGNWSFTYDR